MIGWWIGNAIGLLVVIPLVVLLATRVVVLAMEARRYAADIREHGLGLAGNLESVPALTDTAEQAQRVRNSALAYASALDRHL